MILFHYCTNETFLSIIKHRSIWLSDSTLSNDRLEGIWIRQLLIDRCQHEGFHPRDVEQLLLLYDLGTPLVRAAVFCMSEEGDLLSQWRGYAADGAGLSLGFDSGYFEGLARSRVERSLGEAISIHKVAYSTRDQATLIQSNLDEMAQAIAAGAFDTGSILVPLEGQRKAEVEHQNRKLATSLLMLHLAEHRLKNPAFSEEREWRLSSMLFSYPSEDKSHGDLGKIEYRAGRDRLVPYRVLPLEGGATPSIREVVIGPKNLTAVRYVEAALNRYGWSNVSVRLSTASYR